MRADGQRSNATLPRIMRRGREWMIELLDPIFAPLTLRMARGLLGTREFRWMRALPGRPAWLSRWAEPPVWPEHQVTLPPELRSYPGSERDPEAEAQAFAERPLHDFPKTHAEAITFILQRSWTWLIAPYPALRRGLEAAERTKTRKRATRSGPDHEPEQLSRLIKAEAQRLGLSTIGFAKADSKYTFAGCEDPGSASIIVCVLEQDRAATDTAPSSRAERAAFRAYGQLAIKVATLTEYVQDLGYEARPNDPLGGEAIEIHYAVEAGLGQLGLNGQLLTPTAGSRCRLALITTEAPVRHGAPVDFGIPRICDECQVCVRRCPPGAITKTRREKRGVVKASIKPERCFPVVAQAHGCAVCMKVCPVQRYGLTAVTEHFVRTGQILGKGTDQLEGYVWPLDGRYYGPGERPRASPEMLDPPGWFFDKTRTAPVPSADGGEPEERRHVWS